MIITACQPDAGAGLVSRILGYVDCQAQAIGAGGFQAFGAPNSTLSLIVGALLTIFIALLGYRMLFGQTPDFQDGIIAAVKIGVVLTLAFSWPAYQTLVYDVFLKGPAELASEIGRPAGIPGATGGLTRRLDLADRGFTALGVLGTGAGPRAPVAGATAQDEQLRTASAFDPFALGGARIVYLAGAIGALAGLRMVAGLMLALGPFFVCFLLFAPTRSFFEGWLRVLAGAALGALGSSIVLGVQLALLEPWLAELIAWRNAGYSIPGAAVELFVVSIIFALVLVTVVAAAWRVTVGAGMPAAWRLAPARLMGSLDQRISGSTAGAVEPRSLSAGERSRAAMVVEAVGAVQRRELMRAGPAGGASASAAISGAGGPGPTTRQPLGQTSRRPVHSRVSQSSNRRDERR